MSKGQSSMVLHCVSHLKFGSTDDVLTVGQRHKESSETKMIKSLFSVFPHGYTNKAGKVVPASRPEGIWNVRKAYEYITSAKARDETITLRAIHDKDEQRVYKAKNFITATFGGVFEYRNAKSLSRQSGLMVLDVDDLKDEEEARRVQRMFIDDTRIESALCFVSPSGCGVKSVAVIPDAWKEMAFKDAFTEMRKYFAFEYGIEIDKSGSDICRACYLPWDEGCYCPTPALQTLSPTLPL